MNQGSWLAGNGFLADFVPDDDTMGLVAGPNLTSSATAGLGDWTDEEIKAAITKGVKPNGDAMLSLMPYYEFALLSDADLDALVAYLRTLPASDTIIDPRQPLPFPVSASPALAAGDVPNRRRVHSHLSLTGQGAGFRILRFSVDRERTPPRDRRARLVTTSPSRWRGDVRLRCPSQVIPPRAWSE